jgi:hypothetical protein
MGQQWGSSSEGSFVPDARTWEPQEPLRSGGVEPPRSESHENVRQRVIDALNLAVVPENWRAQFGTVLQTREYLRVVGIVESWPGVAPGRLEEPLTGEDRAAVYAAANRGMRSSGNACEHDVLTQVMVCPLCEPDKRSSADQSGYATLEHRLRKVTAERDQLRRDLDYEVSARESTDGWATKIAEAITPAEVLGDWSGGNSPWANAVNYAHDIRANLLEEIVDELEQLRDLFLAMANRRFENHESGSVEEGESVACEGPGCTSAAECHAVAAVTTWTRAADLVNHRLSELRLPEGDQSDDRE